MTVLAECTRILGTGSFRVWGLDILNFGVFWDFWVLKPFLEFSDESDCIVA